MARLTEPLGVTVGSAGVLEMPGEGSPPETVRAAERLGIDLAHHLSAHSRESTSRTSTWYWDSSAATSLRR
jgi:protein-tyrosine-phosphatase